VRCDGNKPSCSSCMRTAKRERREPCCVYRADLHVAQQHQRAIEEEEQRCTGESLSYVSNARDRNDQLIRIAIKSFLQKKRLLQRNPILRFPTPLPPPPALPPPHRLRTQCRPLHHLSHLRSTCPKFLYHLCQISLHLLLLIQFSLLSLHPVAQPRLHPLSYLTRIIRILTHLHLRSLMLRQTLHHLTHLQLLLSLPSKIYFLDHHVPTTTCTTTLLSPIHLQPHPCGQFLLSLSVHPSRKLRLHHLPSPTTTTFIRPARVLNSKPPLTTST